MTLRLNHFLRPTHFLPSRDANLFLHNVDARTHFRDGMLHLDACVHLQEVKIQVLIDQELHRSSIAIANGFAQLDSSFAHLLAFLLGQRRRRRFLNNFLITALNSTLTLVQMNDVAVMIGQYLYFDMSWIFNVLLNEHRTIAEILLCFARGGFHLTLQVFFFPNDVHSFTAATCRRLY